MKRSTNITLTILTLALLLAGLSINAAAQSKIWTAVGSTGTWDDEAPAANIFMTEGTAGLRLFTPAGTTAIMRYNVTAVDGLFAAAGPQTWPSLIVRYRHAPGRDQIIVRLKEHNFSTGTVTTVITFDSALYPSAGLAQTRALGNCGVFANFDFNNNAYFVEVELRQLNLAGNPWVSMVGLSRTGICLAP